MYVSYKPGAVTFPGSCHCADRQRWTARSSGGVHCQQSLAVEPPLCYLGSGPTQHCLSYMNPVADGQGGMWQEIREAAASFPAAGGSGWLNSWPIASRSSSWTSSCTSSFPLVLCKALSVSNHSNSLYAELTGWEKDNAHGNGRKIREKSCSSPK